MGGVIPPMEVCAATLAVSGTFATDVASRPADYGEGSCWPAGTWTVNLVLSDMGTCDEVAFEQQYVYEVAREGNDFVPAYTGSLADPDLVPDLLVKSEGGICRAKFEHYTDGGKGVLFMDLQVDENQAVTGEVDYKLWDAPRN